MVDVAQLVEPRIVIPVVAGSSPVIHPIILIDLCKILKVLIKEGLKGKTSFLPWIQQQIILPSSESFLKGPLAQLVEQLTLNQ
jgi:hypothetical protein